MRLALYELTPASVRSAVHLAIAKYIENSYGADRRFFAVLGHHFSRSGLAQGKSYQVGGRAGGCMGACVRVRMRVHGCMGVHVHVCMRVCMGACV